MKKQKILVCIIALLGTFTTQVWAYDGCATVPSGQTIYYIYNYGRIVIVPPESNGWGNYDKPTGSLVIPDSMNYMGTKRPVKMISDKAFYNCNGLTSVSIPTTITSIGNQAFSGCTGLDSVIFKAVNCTSAGGVGDSRAFRGCTNITNFSFGQNVSVIPDQLCRGMTSLSTITIPNSVITIGSAAFYECSSLSSVTIGSNVTSIGNSAFRNCVNLTTVTIPDNVTNINKYAFQDDSSLTTVTVGRGVVSIGEHAFTYCPQLDTIYMMPATPPIFGIYDFPFAANAPGRVFILNGCTYDAYYVDVLEHPQWEYWKYYKDDLRHPIYDITINVLSSDTTRGSANVVLGPSDRSIRCDSTAVILATANSPEYRFDHWDNGSTDNPITITLVSDSTIIAYFVNNVYTLTANVNDSNFGFVSFPDGDTAIFGDTLIVVASPAAHYHVDNWSGTGIVATSTNMDSVWVVMNENIAVTCNFVIDKHIVNVSIAENDTDCGSVTGDGLYDYGTTITLNAIANNGYNFDHWSTGSTDNPYTLTVTSDTTVIAYFVSNGGTEGIDEVGEDDIRISVFNGCISIEGVEQKDIQVYDITGRITNNRALPSGVYIVKIGQLPARKVVVLR